MLLFRWVQRLISYSVEVRGQSMEPTCSPGRRLRASRLPYVFRRPSRGELVLVRPPGTADRADVKRVIGLPNEQVAWSRGIFRVNGELLQEPYARIPEAPPGDEEAQSRRLGPDEYFVAGDNRLYSHDSRRYGPVNRTAILAIVLAP